MPYFKSFIIIASLLLTAPYVTASTYVPLDDTGVYIYNTLDYLEAQGVIESGLLTTKPLSRAEIARITLEAERNAEGRSLFIQKLVKSLKEEFKDEISNTTFVKPVDSLYGEYTYSDLDNEAFNYNDNQSLNYNDEGVVYKKGSNLQAGFTSRGDLGWFSFYLTPEVRYYANGSDTDVELKRGYGVLSFLGLDLTAGKDSQWWGPGYNGALLLSNNPEPLTFARLENPKPVILPWIFKYLGPLRFTLFASYLDAERDVSNPILWGARLEFKPLPYIQIGIERASMLGGEGRLEDLEIWWNSITGRNEATHRPEDAPTEPGDGKIGFDVKITAPFKLQPFQLYAEVAGEDEAGLLPTKRAYLAGIYLPRILSIERIGFRAEYAENHVDEYPNVWYTHHIYTSGYTYKKRIIGHHMGTDSNDLFFELSYLIPERNGRISISYDKQKHNLSGDVKEKEEGISLRVNIRLIKGLELKTAYSYGKIENIDNVPDEDKNLNLFTAWIRYIF